MIFFKPNKNFKLCISKYQLKFKNSQRMPLTGCLLLFDFGGGLTGYSDFLPWPLYGEKTLKEQLEDIQQRKFSQRFVIAQQQAFIDAKARQEKRNLFFSLKIPASHFLIDDLLNFKESKKLLSFKTVKVKLKPYQRLEQIKILKELNQMFKNIKWRFDLNHSSWKKWESSLSFLKARMDFIEDPKESVLSLPIAEDWKTLPSAPVKVVKSSRDSLKILMKQWPRRKRIIFTHSLDHPLGQVISAFWAGLFYKYHPSLFETGAFIAFQLEKIKNYELETKEDSFIAPKGFGFGFTRALKNENWRQWI